MTKEINFAFSDESSHNVHRFRSIGLVTMAGSFYTDVKKRLEELLEESDTRELKWSKVSNAKYRLAALKFFDEVIDRAQQKELRVDVLIWDIKDSRHKIYGRDDVKNLQRLYYQLFKHVFKKRWPVETTWTLYPDENNAMDWDRMEDFLDAAGIGFEPIESSSDLRLFKMRLERDFHVNQIEPLESHKEPLVQVADLFAGVAVFSRESFDRYFTWIKRESNHKTLFEFDEAAGERFTNAEINRFPIINAINKRLKSARMQVSLKGSQGFETKNPRSPINFWLYRPQHEKDKAPTRKDN